MSSTKSKSSARIPVPQSARAARPIQHFGTGTRASLVSFRKIVWEHFKKHGRHDLPWRNTHNPYKILVSEVMLQQTQVERVKAFYTNFLVKFPTSKALAKAPLAEVLKSWQGLGYNRRAKMLHEAAKVFPRSNNVDAFEALPGVGPYTARAVAAFAFNADVAFVETNIRSAIIHHFFPRKKDISDAQIIKVVAQVLPKSRAREWYGALMDYGSYLKQSGVKLNAKSKHYTKQSKFKGSNREARGAILRELAKNTRTKTYLRRILGEDRMNQMETALAALIKEGIVQKSGGLYRL